VKAIRLRSDLLEQIERIARQEYPREACGALFARAAEAGGGNPSVSSVEPLANEHAGDPRERFVITAASVRSAEDRARARGEVLLGFFHSHPDRAPSPSTLDTESAWPSLAYLIVSVDGAERRRRSETRAFELSEDRGRLVPRELEIGAALRGEGGETLRSRYR
jgi:desampylase